MRIPLNTICNQDGNQRYKGTFVYAFVENKPIGLQYIHNLNDAGIHFIGAKDQLSYDNSNKSIEIETLMPHAAWMQYKTMSICLHRRPARQWKRSLSNSTHDLEYAFNYFSFDKKDEEELKQLVLPNFNYSKMASLDEMLNNKPLNFAQAYDAVLNQKYFSAAINNKFCLHKGGKLMCGTAVIAKFFFKDKSYKVNKLFVEELRDLTRGVEIKKEIVIDGNEFND